MDRRRKLKNWFRCALHLLTVTFCFFILWESWWYWWSGAPVTFGIAWMSTFTCVVMASVGLRGFAEALLDV